MRFYVTLEPQEGETYGDILAVAHRAEALGFDGLYRSDHYSSVWGGGVGSTDAWATLAGLARETERISIGTMVTPVTFRPAAILAKVVATVAEMAGTEEGASRVHLGLGTGWLETEHTMHGFPFEDMSTRFRRLDEHVRIVRGLWDPGQERFSLLGEFEHLDEALFAPKPEPMPRIIVGGSGRKKTVGLAAEYADELNTPFPAVDDIRDMRSALDAACAAAGRDPIPLTVTAACIVGSNETEFCHRAERLHERIGTGSVERWLEERRPTWAMGTSQQVAAHLTALIEAGADGFMLQHLMPDDLEMLDVLMTEVVTAL